jgi:hypothetical protein
MRSYVTVAEEVCRKMLIPFSKAYNYAKRKYDGLRRWTNSIRSDMNRNWRVCFEPCYLKFKCSWKSGCKIYFSPSNCHKRIFIRFRACAKAAYLSVKLAAANFLLAIAYAALMIVAAALRSIKAVIDGIMKAAMAVITAAEAVLKVGGRGLTRAAGCPR